MTTDITYSFTSSQPLTVEQLNYLNHCLQNLPTTDEENFLDIPECTTDIEII